MYLIMPFIVSVLYRGGGVLYITFIRLCLLLYINSVSIFVHLEANLLYKR